MAGIGQCDSLINFYHRMSFDCVELGLLSQIVILMIAIVDPVLYDSNTLKDTL